MLSHEERIAEVKRRTAEKERQKRLRRRWIAAVSGVAACLAVIVGVSLSMPGIVERIEPGTFSGFGDRENPGYPGSLDSGDSGGRTGAFPG